jgi:glycerophosphoryl diester phosphodiesterase
MIRSRTPILLAWFFGGLILPSHGLAVEIIAHRGASADAPENTLSAMKLAWEQAADAIELDLWLSKDNKLVVFHDADTKRFEERARTISSLTLAEARQLDVGAWKGPQFKGETVPSLESILATIPPGRRAVLELKCGPEILPELRRVLEGVRRAPDELAIISFNLATLKASKVLFPEIDHYLLHGYEKDKATGCYPELEPLIRTCREAGFEGLNLHFDWPIDRSFVSSVHAAGLKLLVWTVDDAAVARRLAEAGVDAITTNRPQWLRRQLSDPRPGR